VYVSRKRAMPEGADGALVDHRAPPRGPQWYDRLVAVKAARLLPFAGRHLYWRYLNARKRQRGRAFYSAHRGGFEDLGVGSFGAFRNWLRTMDALMRDNVTQVRDRLLE